MTTLSPLAAFVPFILAASLLSSGCASTAQDMRTSAAHRTLVVAQPYQAVYRKLVTNARNCWRATSLPTTSHSDVSGDLYTDTRTAEITVAINGVVGAMTTLAVDIKALDDTRTQIDTYAKVADYPNAIERWATTSSTEC
jgi:hypothetical protein